MAQKKKTMTLQQLILTASEDFDYDNKVITELNIGSVTGTVDQLLVILGAVKMAIEVNEVLEKGEQMLQEEIEPDEDYLNWTPENRDKNDYDA